MMPGLPAGYRDWCAQREITPYHPLTWRDDDREAFKRWKRALMRAKWDFYYATGYAQSLDPRRRHDLILQDVWWCDAPPPSRPYAICPCHPNTPLVRVTSTNPEDHVTPEEVKAWVDEDRLARGGMSYRTAAALTAMRKDFERGA